MVQFPYRHSKDAVTARIGEKTAWSRSKVMYKKNTCGSCTCGWEKLMHNKTRICLVGLDNNLLKSMVAMSSCVT